MKDIGAIAEIREFTNDFINLYLLHNSLTATRKVSVRIAQRGGKKCNQRITPEIAIIHTQGEAETRISDTSLVDKRGNDQKDEQDRQPRSHSDRTASHQKAQ